MGFAIQLAFLLIRKDLSPVMILDEPFINLDRVRWELLIEFLQDLQRDISFQLICVTNESIKFPQTFEVTKPGKVSIVVESRDH